MNVNRNSTEMLRRNAGGLEEKILLDPEHHGILPRVLQFVFNHLNQGELALKASFYEIYNDKIFDLLAESEDNAPVEVPSDASCCSINGSILSSGKLKSDKKSQHIKQASFSVLPSFQGSSQAVQAEAKGC